MAIFNSYDTPIFIQVSERIFLYWIHGDWGIPQTSDAV